MASLPNALLPYAQATPAQRTQVLGYLQARLRLHFPALPERMFARALAEFQPDLLFTTTQVGLTDPDLLQFVQYLASSPGLPQFDPPLFGPWALELAQHVLYTSELAVRALLALTASPVSSHPCLGALLRRTARPCSLAERIVQAQRWDLPGSRCLPPGLPGGGPAPGSAAVEQLLRLLFPEAGQPAPASAGAPASPTDP